MWEFLFYAYLALAIPVVVVSAVVEVRRWYWRLQAERVHQVMLAEIAEEQRRHPPPLYDPEQEETRRIELLTAGFRESSPGIFMFPAHPREQARHLETLRDRCPFERQPRCGTVPTP